MFLERQLIASFHAAAHVIIIPVQLIAALSGSSSPLYANFERKVRGFRLWYDIRSTSHGSSLSTRLQTLLAILSADTWARRAQIVTLK